MADKKERGRRTRVRGKVNLVANVHAVVARGSGKGAASSRQSVRVVQRDGETVVHDVSAESSYFDESDRD